MPRRLLYLVDGRNVTTSASIDATIGADGSVSRSDRQRHRSAKHVPDVHDEQAIGLRRQLTARTQSRQAPAARLSLLHSHPLVCHVVTDLVFVVTDRRFERLPIP